MMKQVILSQKECISLYSAVTELTKDRYPELGNQFYEMANTIYPYGIISLSKINNISYMEAEKIFFDKSVNIFLLDFCPKLINGC